MILLFKVKFLEDHDGRGGVEGTTSWPCEGSRKDRRNSAAVHGGLVDEGSHVGLEEGVDEDMEQE